MKITKVQKKLVEEIYGKGDFYEVEEVLYFHSKDGEKTYRVDFDNKVYKRMDGSIISKDTTLNKKKNRRKRSRKRACSGRYYSGTSERTLLGGNT